MLIKQVDLLVVLYWNVMMYLFNRDHWFSMHYFFQEVLLNLESWLFLQ